MASGYTFIYFFYSFNHINNMCSIFFFSLKISLLRLLLLQYGSLSLACGAASPWGCLRLSPYFLDFVSPPSGGDSPVLAERVVRWCGRRMSVGGSSRCSCLFNHAVPVWTVGALCLAWAVPLGSPFTLILESPFAFFQDNWTSTGTKSTLT